MKSQEPITGRGPTSPETAKRQLYERQCALLDAFLKKGAISRAQYERSLGDLTEKMGYGSRSPASEDGSSPERGGDGSAAR